MRGEGERGEEETEEGRANRIEEGGREEGGEGGIEGRGGGVIGGREAARGRGGAGGASGSMRASPPRVGRGLGDPGEHRRMRGAGEAYEQTEREAFSFSLSRKEEKGKNGRRRGEEKERMDSKERGGGRRKGRGERGRRKTE